MEENQKFLYEKVNGRYKKVSVYDSRFYDYYNPGHYLISVEKTWKTTRRDVEPALIPLIAAATSFERDLTEGLVKCSSVYKHTVELTPEQREAWEHFAKLVEKQKWTMYGPSYADVARGATQKLIEKAAEMMEVPAVKEAYEEFLLVYKLAVDEKTKS